ncbi:single-stranded-DNA-specific exonuclease RecJ [Pelagicoccus sp. NFK12]|uniref:Single-stranded-DNA-specific exonuclease RecJ n=1 Tax=Pelagicoccus enzymogenes TaxID=2773457 RepID=A0A927IHW4_9BACT|nr:single-stranded-DNA-specific exonuclease RecJ [Pelagicoccus enzymogenes]MBD5780118.1 single-stranded-DNA-specific exonuclease RecJ [Pelagicoccus enzymogenes]MDQ8200662.1 single-stranded-DNA-specific exonuclease RecJ [Pelagicoccus enzymogenes]
MAIWEYSPPATDLSKEYIASLKVGPTVAELLARLDFSDVEEARRFLDPRLGAIDCPFEIANLKKAAQRVSQAIDNRQSIAICGDYDVDGVTSTALMVAILQEFENYPAYIVPLRLEEGYGLSEKAVERALNKANQPDLFIALDCGTNSVEAVQRILDAGCEVIIVDHHQAKEELPEEVTLVNPHVNDRDSENHCQLCTVGLVFKLAHGILKIRRERGDPRAFEIKLRNYLDLVSMGTVADMVPLNKENRTFARIGLQVLSKTERIGLKNLMKVSGVAARHGVNPIDVSFRLGPRINASGRLADASVAVELILSDDPSFCMETSLQLDSFNRERQEIERAMTESAMQQIKSEQSEASGFVVYGDDWHPGVVGIVASRVSKAFNRPAIVLGREGDLAKGSGRSIEGVNLVEVLAPFSDRLENWGGHPMAVGISLKKERVPEFAAFFDKALAEYLATHQVEKTLQIAAWLRLEDINTKLMKDLSLLEPFGQANPEPVFGARRIRFGSKVTVFKDIHFRFTLPTRHHQVISGVAWKMADRIPPAKTPVDIAFRLVWNTFGNKKALQLELVDWRES